MVYNCGPPADLWTAVNPCRLLAGPALLHPFEQLVSQKDQKESPLAHRHKLTQSQDKEGVEALINSELGSMTWRHLHLFKVSILDTVVYLRCL